LSIPPEDPAQWRVVLDTNVLISAYQFGGKPKAILDLAEEMAFVALTSDPLRNELARVLAEKFFMPHDLIVGLCSRLWDVSEWVDPRTRVDLCQDEADNRVLECALEGNAGYIVTGDRHLLDLKPIEGLVILLPDRFLGLFRLPGSAS
jgi:putative PIN family toxin of toxin-antitoxin system